MKGLVQMIFLFKGSDFMWFSGSKGVRFEFLQLLKSATRTDFSMGKSSDASHLWTRLRRVGLGNDDFLKTWEREPNREIAAFLLGAKDKDMKLSECISTAHLRWHLWSSFQADAGCFHHWPACHVHPGAQQFRDHVSNVFPRLDDKRHDINTLSLHPWTSTSLMKIRPPFLTQRFTTSMDIV